MTNEFANKPIINNRVLLVEDEFLIALDMADGLSAGGFDIVGPCQTVSQALSQLARFKCCDAAVLDAALRNESAAPVAVALAAQGIPFVVVTGYSKNQLPAELCAGPLLFKPVNVNELIGQVTRLINKA